MTKAVKQTNAKAVQEQRNLEWMKERARRFQPPESQMEGNNRLTIVFSAHYERIGQQPQPISSTYSQLLTKSDKDMYVRRLEAGPRAAALDFSWFKPQDVRKIVIENLAGKGLLYNPTKEQKVLFESQILKLFYKGSTKGWLVYPYGDIFAASPDAASDLRIQSLSQEPVFYNLYAIPK